MRGVPQGVRDLGTQRQPTRSVRAGKPHALARDEPTGRRSALAR